MKNMKRLISLISLSLWIASGISLASDSKNSIPSDVLCATQDSQVNVEKKVSCNSDSAEIFDISAVDVPPEFPGGETGLMRYIVKNLKYPKKAVKRDIQGDAMVSFVIEKDGSITHIKPHCECDATLMTEAVRVVKMMPRWKPAMKNGQAVRTRYVLPCRFRLH